MIFADLKNDFVFRRIFGSHPDILRGLLNDLLARTGDELIETLEYLPSEQIPHLEGWKLSILDVRCRDRAGTTFVVEMQLVHHPGFVNRVVYNACKAYARQLKAGEWYSALKDVVAISICDFELWPDAEHKKEGLPLVPMLSRWSMKERSTNNDGILQVQYAFLELPKLPDRRPSTPGADLWAWLFVHAPELTEIPPELVPGPHRDALDLANQAKFTPGELEAYEKTRDEIRQVLEIAAERWAQGKAAGAIEGKIEGKIEGRIEGKIEGKAEAILTILTARGLAVDEAIHARIKECSDPAALERWLVRALSAASASEVVDFT